MLTYILRVEHGGWAFAGDGMDWSMYQALDAVAIAEGVELDFDFLHVQATEGHFGEGVARARQYGYWLS